MVLGCAKDIVELCGVARFVFSDFPLGNAAGKPHDWDSPAYEALKKHNLVRTDWRVSNVEGERSQLAVSARSSP